MWHQERSQCRGIDTSRKRLLRSRGRLIFWSRGSEPWRCGPTSAGVFEMRVLVFSRCVWLCGTALVRYLHSQGYDGWRKPSARPDGAHCSYVRITDSADVAWIVNAVQQVVIFHVRGAIVTRGAGRLPGRRTIAISFGRRCVGAPYTQSHCDRLGGRVRPAARLPSAQRKKTCPAAATECGAAKLKQTVLALAAASCRRAADRCGPPFQCDGPGMSEHLALGRFARCISISPDLEVFSPQVPTRQRVS